jgi:acetylornithine deacetylase/succinyl-diaminopimelate desuccinylase-like protein
VLSDESLIGQLKEAVQNAQPLIQQLVSQTSSSSSSSAAAGGSSSSSISSSSSKSLSMLQDTVPVMMSGAGHDAMAIADITKIGMVFVRCAGGVSHNPAEFVDPRDVAAAAAAFATFMEMDLLDGASSTAVNGRVFERGSKDEL